MMDFFEIGSCELFAWLALNCEPPDLCLLSSEDYRHELPVSGRNLKILHDEYELFAVWRGYLHSRIYVGTLK
jgi:hypothetical protein